jgi:hypothetical protein
MESKCLETPVLFLVFNRPESTREVFEAIRAAKPKLLFVAADGPRLNVAGEKERCEEVRRIATSIDWDCEVSTFFHEQNAGCGIAVSSAINWFFEEVEEGIILEDDCLPCPEFFTFCTVLLERYRHDNRVMQIGGVNWLLGVPVHSTDSYWFSNQSNIWGWASWRRAWKYYDYQMTAYGSISKNDFYDSNFGSAYERTYYHWSFELTYRAKRKSSWDYQWEFSRRINSGLTICPLKNLVVNIGFGEHATHTTAGGGAASRLTFEKLDWPLRHPAFVLPNRKFDTLGFIRHHTTPQSRLKAAMRSWLPASMRDLWTTWRLKAEMKKRPDRYYEDEQREPANVSIRKSRVMGISALLTLPELMLILCQSFTLPGTNRIPSDLKTDRSFVIANINKTTSLLPNEHA